MKKRTWRKQHKWLGIGMAFFLLMFCVSGVLLNHRQLIKNMNVSRKFLPNRYEFSNWNGGLLRGTLDISNLRVAASHEMRDSYHQKLDYCQEKPDSCQDLLLYGNGGIWLTNSKASSFKDFNEGLPSGADLRQIRNVVKTERNGHKSCMFAVSPFALYRYGAHGAWHEVEMPLDDDERLTDIACHGDTLVVLSRSFAYTSLPPYTSFSRVKIHAPKDYDGKVTAFRMVWLLHSGELFGTAGKLAVDAVAVVLVLLCITGIVFWLRPRQKFWLKHSLLLHDRTGRYTILLTLLIATTGWCLRPPVMIALVLNKIPAIHGTTLCSKNPWNDKLRMVAYDDMCHDWLLSTSDGFYSLNLQRGVAKKIEAAPPVSVMGLNVLQKDNNGRWLCGSFSGLFVWDRQMASSTDYFTGKPAPKQAGAPFGKKAIAGLSQNFSTPVIAEYYEGSSFAAQPAIMNQLPMSLWNVALEAHSGRLFIGSIATYVFIFIMGALVIWCLWSGYRIRLKK